MNVTVWIVVVVAVLFAGGCGTSTLPAYTPTPMDIYKAYSTGLDDLEAALDDLQEARSAAFGKLDTTDEVTLKAVQEASNCDVPIDDLTNDPRDELAAIAGITADPRVRAASDAPRLVAHDVAAARVASPANRSKVEDALSAYLEAQLQDRAPPDDPVLRVYLNYLEDDPAFNAYLEALDSINANYFPVSNSLYSARKDFISALIQSSEVTNCTGRLFAVHEAFVRAYEANFYALSAYFGGIRAAVERYANALERASASYAQR